MYTILYTSGPGFIWNFNEVEGRMMPFVKIYGAKAPSRSPANESREMQMWEKKRRGHV